MKCPSCGHLESKVIDSRPSADGNSIRRRRECLECRKRFTTYETIEMLPLIVIKKDLSRLRQTPRFAFGNEPARGRGRIRPAELAGERGALQPDRRNGDGAPEKVGRGRLRALRFGLPPFLRYRRFYGRAQKAHAREMIRVLSQTRCFGEGYEKH